jgi:ABC-type branched-subunit amino acid transport system ATPase component/ABC-type branched-subunit amino acid transport system permease subunit
MSTITSGRSAADSPTTSGPRFSFDPIRHGLPLIGLALIVAWPLIAGNGFLAPRDTFVDLGSSALISVMLVYALNLSMGYSGLLSLMHPGFLGLGAYAVGLLVSRSGVPMGLVIPLALVVGALIGAFASALSLRATYLYFGLITLSFNNVLHEVAKEWTGVTGGDDGLTSLPNRIDFVDGIATPRSYSRWLNTNQRYFAVLLFTLAVYFVHRNIVRSRTGRSFQAIRESGDTAMALGINVSKTKVLAFALSGSLGSLAGVLFGYHEGFTNPAIVADVGLFLFGGLLLGGTGTIMGPFIGVILFKVIEQVLARQNSLDNKNWALLIQGVILWLLLIVLPKGLVGSLSETRIANRGRTKRATSNSATAPVDASRVLAWASAETTASPAASTATTEVVISASGVTKSFGGVQALQGVDLTVRRQEIHGIMGPNGCGKSTTVNCITGYFTPDAGTLELFGKQPPTAPDQIARLGIVRVFQVPHLFERVSALENVLTGMHLRSKQNWLTAALRMPSFFSDEKRLRTEGRDLLQLAGLGDKADELAANLSHGQKRLLEVVRAVAAHPKILILDEPATGLTTEEVAELGRLIKLLQVGGLTIVLIEHNVNFVMNTCDRITVMEQGKVIAVGPPEQIQQDDNVQRAYLGGGDVLEMLGL